ncbi:ATP synthase subunit d, mitochondrial-like [Eupeodes corollae]|uniref:ATP synthase subunit d, mitochondrial-like n=1 Tax=Eupeodes corollae TaxID=290404 RepID=UPI00248FC96D|nr:ATP synthase subunit d, mitochondrial-like [Eupeodes corollae]
MVPKQATINFFSFFELRKRCPKNQIKELEYFYSKHLKYRERLLILKKDAPVIDWEYYRQNVRSKNVPIVNELEKQYKSFCVPYPEDIYAKKFDELKAIVEVEVAEFIKQSNQRIAKYEERIATLKSMLPYDQMTWEDYCNLCPEEAPDFLNKPTFWPHNKEEQIGYVENEEDVMRRLYYKDYV